MNNDTPKTRREPQTLAAWESWVDKLIRDAQERGEFDDLAGQGKPLHIEEAPFAGGLEVGYGLLKNANVAPIWIELGREIDAAERRLSEILEKSAQLSRVPETPPNSVSPIRKQRSWWTWLLAWFVAPPAPESVPEPSADARREIARLRRSYVDIAIAMDERIAQYNATIPRELWHLERPRMTRERAEQEFNANLSAARE